MIKNVTHSTIKPEPIEIDAYSVYVNKNIKETVSPDTMTSSEEEASSTVIYEYDQYIYDKDEYIRNMSEAQSDIEDAVLELAELVSGVV